jgi:hypothetical protein
MLLNALHINFSIHMNFKSMVRLVSCKLSHDILDALFSKSLSYATFSKCVAGIGMRRLRDLQDLGGALS